MEPPRAQLLRLHVQVLDWRNSKVVDETIRPFRLHYPPRFLLTELPEEIVRVFGSVHPEKGKLEIKHLEAVDGTVIPLLDEWFVDQCFTDGEIVRVARFPPQAHEYPGQTRYASLAPDSSARPKKRSHPSLLGSAITKSYGYDIENGINSPVIKRQRIDRGGDTQGEVDPDRPIQSRELETSVEEVAQSSIVPQPPSSYVIADSQKSPRKNMQNVVAIPFDNMVVDQTVGNEEPKSESSEVENLVYSVPASNPGTPRGSKLPGVENVSGNSRENAIPAAMDCQQKPCTPIHSAKSTKLSGPLHNQSLGKSKSSDGRLQRPMGQAERSTPGHKKYKGSSIHGQDRDPYDVIESDIGGSQELSQLRVAKKAKLQHSPVRKSPSLPRPFHQINDITDQSNHSVLVSGQRSFESPARVAEPVLLPVTSVGHYAAKENSEITSLSAKKTTQGPNVRHPTTSTSDQGRVGLSDERAGNPKVQPIAKSELESVLHHDSRAESPVDQSTKSPSSVGAGSHRERLCAAPPRPTGAQGRKSPAIDLASQSSCNHSKDASFEAADVSGSHLRRTHEQLELDSSTEDDSELENKTAKKVASPKAAAKKSDVEKLPAEQGGKKRKQARLKAKPEINPTKSEQQIKTEAKLQEQQGVDRPPSSVSLSTSKPSTGARKSLTPFVPEPRSAMKKPSPNLRSSSLSSRETPSRHGNIDSKMMGPPTAFRSSPSLERHVSFAKNPIKPLDDPLPRKQTPAEEHKDQISVKTVTPNLYSTPKHGLDETRAVDRPEPVLSPRSWRRKVLEDAIKNGLGPKIQTTLNVIRDKGKQVVRDPPSPRKATGAKEAVNSSKSNESSPESEQVPVLPSSKAGPSRSRSTSKSKESSTVADASGSQPSMPEPSPGVTSTVRKSSKDSRVSGAKRVEKTSEQRAASRASEIPAPTEAQKESPTEKVRGETTAETSTDAVEPAAEETALDESPTLKDRNKEASPEAVKDSKSQSRSPAREVFSSSSPSSASETETSSDLESESGSKKQSPSGSKSDLSNSSDIKKITISQTVDDTPSVGKSGSKATNSDSESESESESETEEDEVPLPKQTATKRVDTGDTRTPSKSPGSSTASQSSRNSLRTQIENIEDEAARQIQRENWLSSGAQSTPKKMDLAHSTPKLTNGGPKTPSTATATRPLTNSRFQGITTLAANTTANGQTTKKLPGYKMPLKSPVTPASKALSNAADGNDSSEEDESSSEEGEETDGQAGETEWIKSSQSTGKAAKKLRGLMRLQGQLNS